MKKDSNLSDYFIVIYINVQWITFYDQESFSHRHLNVKTHCINKYSDISKNMSTKYSIYPKQ